MKLMPQEIEVWYIIPSIRRELAKALKGKGLPQKEIALTLGITEPAVSQYLHDKRASGIEFDEKLLKLVNKSAEILIQDPKRTVNEIQLILGNIRNSKLMCEVHRKYDSELGDCEVCFN
tara:strand:+ start:750 stop:1106 length:357 start_codon:yes stop_codon:yes gene_type:complete